MLFVFAFSLIIGAIFGEMAASLSSNIVTTKRSHYFVPKAARRAFYGCLFGGTTALALGLIILTPGQAVLTFLITVVVIGFLVYLLTPFRQ